MKKVYCLITSLILAASCYAGTDVGVGFGVSQWTRSKKKEEPKKTRDVYIRVLAGHFKRQEAELEKLAKKGYGRNELIKLILISQKSGQEFDKLIKQRDKDIKLSRIAEKYNVDYVEVLKESVKERKTVDYKVSISTFIAEYEVKKSTESIIKYTTE